MDNEEPTDALRCPHCGWLETIDDDGDDSVLILQQEPDGLLIRAECPTCGATLSETFVTNEELNKARQNPN